jgi:hypothetical protein
MTGLLIVHWKAWPALEAPSLAVTVVVKGPLADAPALIVPEIKPVVESMLRPAGSPAAL